MFRPTTLAAVAAALLCVAAGAPAQPPADRPTSVTATPDPPSDGPHRDPPGIKQAQFVPPCPSGWRLVPPGVNPALRCLPNHLVATQRPLPTRAPPPGCPQGWKPVSPELNPVLRCQPGSLAAQQPSQPVAPRRPIGCPEGWRAVPAGVNPLLRCLPDSIAATPPPQRTSGPTPVGCPDGWRAVPPEVNPLMRCLPNPIASAGGPDLGEPR